MGFSRSSRIWTLLAIDSAFFFLEIIVGYAVGSLALVADSFHMLNDVLSLIVALYALQLAQRKHTSEEFTYGWQRAEVLGALVNGVFLLALCFSIFMEALERFFKSPEVGNPKLVVIVGSLGLLSNIVGLFLFHDHGHSHGGHSHGHSHSHGSHAHASEHSHSHAHDHSSAAEEGRAKPKDLSQENGKSFVPYRDNDDAVSDSSSISDPDDLVSVHPAQTRANVVRAAQLAGYGAPQKPRARHHARSASQGSVADGRNGSAKTATLIHIDEDQDAKLPNTARSLHEHEHHHDHGPEGHAHATEEAEDSHNGHDHGGESGSMNMRGVFLHVMGDALGNVGVIGTGLFIWLSDFSWRSYSDPIISLVITCIIFSSALPLVRSASFILLQGTPSHVPLEEVRSAIVRVEGVLDVHELHVWSLSESKLIGSVHVLVKTQDYITVASSEIRSILHRFGIHSSTIQPEVVHTALPDGAAGEQLIGDVDLQTGQCAVTCIDRCATTDE